MLCAVAVALTILFATSNYWGRFLGGFVGLRVGILLMVDLAFGETPFEHRAASSHRDTLELLIFCAVLIVLSWPLFASKRVTDASEDCTRGK